MIGHPITAFLGHFDSYCWVAGGAILSNLLNTPAKDIDVFFTTESDREKAVQSLLDKGGNYFKKLRLGDSVKFNGIKYDLLLMGITPQETIDSFDYTVCSIAIDSLGVMYNHPMFFEHLSARKLVYTGQEKWFAGISGETNTLIIRARRMARYLGKGFQIDDTNIRTIAEFDLMRDFQMKCDNS